MLVPTLVTVRRADSPSVICAGSIVVLTGGGAAQAGAVTPRYAVIPAISQPRIRFVLIVTNS
jgi:hypothetical protein